MTNRSKALAQSLERTFCHGCNSIAALLTLFDNSAQAIKVRARSLPDRREAVAPQQDQAALPAVHFPRIATFGRPPGRSAFRPYAFVLLFGFGRHRWFVCCPGLHTQAGAVDRRRRDELTRDPRLASLAENIPAGVFLDGLTSIAARWGLRRMTDETK